MLLEFYDTGSDGIVKESSSFIYESYHNVEHACDGGSLERRKPPFSYFLLELGPAGLPLSLV